MVIMEGQESSLAGWPDTSAYRSSPLLDLSTPSCFASGDYDKSLRQREFAFSNLPKLLK